MGSDVDRWPSESRRKDVISEFWQNFNTVWVTLKVQWLELGSKTGADKDIYRAVEALHHTAHQLNTLLRSLHDYIWNRSLVAEDSDIVTLKEFVHDLRAPLASILSLSEPTVVSTFNNEAHFLQWRELLTDPIARTDRVIVGDTAMFTQWQNKS